MMSIGTKASNSFWWQSELIHVTPLDVGWVTRVWGCRFESLSKLVVPKTIRWEFIVPFRPDRGWVTVAGIRCCNSKFVRLVQCWTRWISWTKLGIDMTALGIARSIFTLFQVNGAHMLIGNLSVFDRTKLLRFQIWKDQRACCTRYVASTILPNHAAQSLPEMPAPVVVGDKVQKILKGILHQKIFYRLNLIFWIVMGQWIHTSY